MFVFSMKQIEWSNHDHLLIYVLLVFYGVSADSNNSVYFFLLYAVASEDGSWGLAGWMGCN